MNARALIFLLFLTLPWQAAAQGFAGLGSDASGFALPDPAARLTFPEDHGPHPGFRIEWWYLTANLTGPDGTDYGIQWTLFRSELAPGAAPIWMGHAAITTPDSHHVAERLARGGTGQADVTASPFNAHIDDWTFSGADTGPNTGPNTARLTARGLDFAFDLALSSTHPFVPQGAEGYSVKSPHGQASHYYSQPFYAVRGKLDLPDKTVEVAGQAWLDREWSSQPLSGDQTGWDWFSLHLDSGEKLMGFRLRSDQGHHTVATWIDADGTPHPEPANTLRLTPLQNSTVAGRNLPTRWQVQLPKRNLDITVTALYPKAWMATSVPYWEGPVRATGSHGARGYLEMTGYE